MKQLYGVCYHSRLEMDARAFRRPLTELNERQQTVLEAIQMMGGLTPQQIKEETGLLNKEIMPVLHRLQEAFVVYEDQVAANWDRTWYEFAAEWPEVELEAASWEASATQVGSVPDMDVLNSISLI